MKKTSEDAPLIVQVREQTHSCVVAGRQQSFKLARLCLPGPYTFILNAGKDLPKLCLQEPGSKVRGRCKLKSARPTTAL